MDQHLTILSRESADSPWKIVAHTKMRANAFAAYWTSVAAVGTDCTMMLRRQAKSRDAALKACRARNRAGSVVETFDAAEFMGEATTPADPPRALPVVAPAYDPLLDESRFANAGTQLGDLQRAIAARRAAQHK